MCANYIPPTPKDLEKLFKALAKLVRFEYAPEAFPVYKAPMVRPDESGQAILTPGCFGLIPHWAKDTTVARNTYNARSETVAEKPSFSPSWKAGRFCLIPIQAFYEPRYSEDGKTCVRWRIDRKDGEPFAAAGIWGSWNHPANGERIDSFSMLTINADAHPFMQDYHKPGDEKRSIVLLQPNSYADWLSIKEPEQAREFLKPFNPEEYQAKPEPKPKQVKAVVKGGQQRLI